MKSTDIKQGDYYLLKIHRERKPRPAFLHGRFVNEDCNGQGRSILKFLIYSAYDSTAGHVLIPCNYIAYVFAYEVVKCLGNKQEYDDHYLQGYRG